MLKNILIDTQNEVLKQLERTRGNFAEVARAMNLTPQEVRNIDIVRNKKYNYTVEGRGRPELMKYIIAIKSVNAFWDNSIPEVAAARADYEAGKTIMVTGRDGMNNILYSIPRKTPVEPNNYFTLISITEEEDLRND